MYYTQTICQFVIMGLKLLQLPISQLEKLIWVGFW